MLRRAGQREEGFVLVWFCLVLLALLAVSAFAVDVGMWYSVRNGEQHQADTAALAGSVMMPDLNAATNVAIDNAMRNGVCTRQTITAAMIAARQCTGPNLTMMVSAVPNNPNAIQVTVTKTVKNIIAGVIGVPTATLSRSAVGEYQAPIAMGSPLNTLGNQPVPEATGTPWSNTSNQGAYWINAAGYGASKSNGDRFLAHGCGGDYCDPSNTAVNGEYDPNGYFFPVHLAPGAAGTLAIDVFDPAFVNVGDNCTSSNLNVTSQTDPAFSSTLYASGTASPYCTGDNSVGGVGVQTTFALRAADGTSSYLDNPLITSAGCTPKTYGSHDGGIAADLDSWTDPQSGKTLRQEFRKWIRVCTISVSNPNSFAVDYPLQVTTAMKWASGGANLSANTSASSQAGHNRFAIRAGFVSSGGAFSTASGVSMYAGGRLPIYANATGANTQFFLAQLPPGPNGRTLQVDFFDTGDAGGPGDISLVPPAGATATINGSTQAVTVFTGCALRFGATASTQSDSACTVHIDNSTSAYNGNGKVVSLFVPIPADYTCGTTAGTDCWIRAKFQYGSSVSVQDTTTWSAGISGDPVRLIQ